MSHPVQDDGATVFPDVQLSSASRLDSMLVKPLQTARTHFLPILGMTLMLFLGPLQRAADAQDNRPTVEAAIDAWMTTRAWVDELHVPTIDRLQAGESGPVVEGASVVLRFRGRIIGIGDDYDNPEDALRRAVLEAVQDARNSNRVRDLPFEMIESVGRETTIELELAGKPTPLLGKTFVEIASEIQPGIDGLAIRRGTKWRWSFPGRMQAFGLADRPDRVMVRLLRELGLPPKEPAELRRIDDVEFYEFPVVIMTQETPQGAPFESIRGSRAIPRGIDTKLMAQELAQGAATNLEARLASDPKTDVGDIPGAERLQALGLFGDYDLSIDSFKPLVAPPADQALAAWALARYANEVTALPDTNRAEARKLAGLILERLEQIDNIETEPLSDERAVPLIVLAGLALYGIDDPVHQSLEAPPIVAHAREKLLRQIQDDSVAPDDEEQPSGVSGILALQALAASELAQAQPGLIPIETLTRIIKESWRAQSPDRLVSSLHFLLLAERALGDHENSESHRAATRHLIEGAIANQIGHPDSLAAPEDPAGDLSGGFVLSGSPRPTATASSLRPATALVAALNNGWVPSPDREAAWQYALALALRFARQLQVEAMHAHRTPAPNRALGGLKTAPWSNQSRTSDSALALILATEVLAGSKTSPPPAKTVPEDEGAPSPRTPPQ